MRGKTHTRNSYTCLYFAISMTLSSCAYLQVPYELKQYQQHVSETARVPEGQPSIYVIPQSDGLGWFIRVIQQERIHQTVTVHEEWTTRNRQECNHNEPTGAFFLNCDFLHLTQYYPSQKHTDSLLTDRVLSQQSILKHGSILLQWTPSHLDPIEVETPLSTDSTDTSIRLPWLSNVLRRNGAFHESVLEGTGRMGYRHPNGTITWSSITITPEMIRAASEQQVWTIDKTQWPTPISVRIDSQTHNQAYDTEVERLLTQTLRDHRVQVVVRGNALDLLKATRKNHLHPNYKDSTHREEPIEPATILLTINSIIQGSEISMSMELIDIATGRLIGMARAEDHITKRHQCAQTLAILTVELLDQREKRREGWTIR